MILSIARASILFLLHPRTLFPLFWHIGSRMLKTTKSTGQSKGKVSSACVGLSSHLQKYKFGNAQVEKLLTIEADIDNSGIIDYGEFIVATVHLNKLEKEENLVSAFSYFDKDGSGYITIDEIQQTCKEFGLDDVHIDEIVKEIDQDDNYSPIVAYLFIRINGKFVLEDGQFDYGEFAAMMRKGNGGIGRQTMRSTLNYRDTLGIKGHGSVRFCAEESEI